MFHDLMNHLMDDLDPTTRELPMSPDPVERLLARHGDDARALVARVLRDQHPVLSAMVQDHYATGGKRLRTALPLWIAEALGADPSRFVPFAAACEMLHNATLVHDDLQDGDTVRRGQPTIWTTYGAPQAINAGDAMFHLALRLVLALDAPAEIKERLTARFVDGALAVIGGQVGEFALLDVEEPSEDDYLRVVGGKTSGLFQLPIVGAAMLAGAPDDVVAALERAAVDLGILFQVQDDLLDLYGDKGRGTVADDLREGKRSLLVVHALTVASDADRTRLRAILDTPRADVTDADVSDALAILERTDAKHRALDEIADRRRALCEDLGATHPGLWAVLDGLADKMLDPIRHLVKDPADADIAFCQRMLPEVSRTFALSIEALSPPLREAVRVGYLLCRILDTVEDDPTLDLGSREALFDAFDEAMTGRLWKARRFVRLAKQIGLGDVAAERELVLGAASVFRRFHALPPAQRTGMIPPILEMSKGMRKHAAETHAHGVLQIPDVPALEAYCYYVAGTVGELLTHLFLGAVPVDATLATAIRERSVGFGLALQIVNIVKDAAEDQTRGVTYLPDDVIARHGLTAADLTDPDHRDAAMAVVHDVCDVARKHLETAMSYTALWPADGLGVDVRRFCLVPLVLAAETLGVVEQGDATLVEGMTPKVTREIVAQVVAAAEAAAADDEVLTTWFARYRRQGEASRREA